MAIAIALSIAGCSGSRGPAATDTDTDTDTDTESEAESEAAPAPESEAAPAPESEAESEAATPSPIAWLLFHDIQALEGGRALYVEADGSALARIVEPPPTEHRYRGTLDAAQLDDLARQLVADDFLHMTVPDRPGIPDESRAVLIVRFASGEERRVEKWDGVRHAGFSDLSGSLRALTEALRRHGQRENVQFDGTFHPPGPWPNPFAP